MSVIPPYNFGLVTDDLYRSAHPNELNFPFLESLRLRKIIDLANQDPGPDFRNWLRDQKIEVIHLGQVAGMRSTLKTLSEEEVVEGLRLLLDPQNYPVLVMCTLGRHRTGTLIGCLRKLQRWALSSILEEYRRHAGAKFNLLSEQFIEVRHASSQLIARWTCVVYLRSPIAILDFLR